MRTFLSTVLGLGLLVGLFTAGGASSVVDGAVAAVTPTPMPFDLPFTEPAEPTTTTTVPAPMVPDPGIEQPRTEWFGCAPPERDTVCGPLVETGLERLVPSNPTSVEDWRPLVEHFFEDRHVDKALRVMRCESGGDPNAKNPHSTASGLFQHLGSLWTKRAVQAGFAGADVFDPIANVGAAAWLVYEGGGWGHWYPSAHCW